MRSESSVTVVIDRGADQPAFALLAQLHERRERRFVGQLPERAAAPISVLHELLYALSFRRSVARLPRSLERTEELLSDRLDALGPQPIDVFLGLASDLRPDAAEALRRLARYGRIRFWLLSTRRLSRPVQQAFEPLAWHEMDGETFCGCWCDDAAGPIEAAADRQPATFPAVPRHDTPAFLAACRFLLDEGEYQRVLRTTMAGYAEALERLDNGHDANDLDLVLGHVRCATTGFHERLATARGAQLAYMQHEYWLSIDHARFYSAVIAHDLVLDDETCRVLEAIPQPRNAALVVAYAVTHASSRSLAELRVGDVTVDGTAISLARHAYPVPTRLAMLLATQSGRRRRSGARADDFLFAGDSGAPTPTSLREVLRTTLERVGLAEHLGQRVGSEGTDGSFAERFGLSLQPLEATA